jgi:hypothetical protein
MRRLLVVLVLLVLFAGAVVILWPSGGSSIGHTVRLSDGTTLTLKAVTFGTEHRYRGGGLWQQVLRLVPPKLVARFDPRRDAFTTARPSIAFWLARSGNTQTTGDLVLCDSSGFGVCGDYVMTRRGAPGAQVEGWAFEYWPRRAPTFTLRIYERGRRWGQAKLMGEFVIRNPQPRKYPVWAAPPPPITARVEDLSITLLDLVAGAGPGSYDHQPASNPTHAITRADFRVERAGQLTREWELVNVESSDATGNWIPRYRGTGAEGDVKEGELMPHPWPAESAWKLRAGFSQRSGFLPSELWTLRGLPVWGSSPTNDATLQTNLQGVMIEYTGQARRSWLNGNQHFNFRLTPARPDYRLRLVKATDDQGHEAKVENWYESPSEWAFALDVNTNARSLDLTVAFHRTRYAEFLVKPRIILTNEGPVR